MLAVRLVSCQCLGALLVSDRIRTLQRELCRNLRSIGAAQVLNKNRRELSGFLTYLVHRDLIPYGIAAMLHHAVFPIELNSSQAGFVRFSRLRRFGGSPEANALVGLHADPDRIRHHGVGGVTQSTHFRSAGSERMMHLLQVDIRARESHRCIQRSFGITEVLYMYQDILDVITCIGYVDSIP